MHPADEHREHRGPRGGVTVRGAGAVDVTPDVVVADLATEARAGDVGSALSSATAALAAVRAALRTAGVPDADVRTGTTSTWTEHVEDRLRVVAHLGLVVTLRHVPTAGDVVTAALAAGGDEVRLGGLRLVVADPGPARVQARELAWQDARASAEHLAHLAGRGLGPVLWVHEDDPSGGAAPAFARVAGAIPVEPGEQAVRAALTARWAWAD